MLRAGKASSFKLYSQSSDKKNIKLSEGLLCFIDSAIFDPLEGNWCSPRKNHLPMKKYYLFGIHKLLNKKMFNKCLYARETWDEKHETLQHCSHVWINLINEITLQNHQKTYIFCFHHHISQSNSLTCHSCRADHFCAAWRPRLAGGQSPCGTWRPRPRPPRGLWCACRARDTGPRTHCVRWPHLWRPPASGHPLSACAGAARTCTCLAGYFHSGAHCEFTCSLTFETL